MTIANVLRISTQDAAKACKILAENQKSPQHKAA